MGLTTSAAKSNLSLLFELQGIRGELRFFLKQVDQNELSPKETRHRSRELLDTLKQLRDLVAIHFILEQNHGYMSDPGYLASLFREEMDGLRAEHQSLHMELSSLVEHGERLFQRGRYVDLARDSIQRYRGFLQNVKDHEDREVKLIAAFQADVIHAASSA